MFKTDTTVDVVLPITTATVALVDRTTWTEGLDDPSRHTSRLVPRTPVSGHNEGTKPAASRHKYTCRCNR